MITTERQRVWRARTWLLGATTLLILMGLTSQAAGSEVCGEVVYPVQSSGFSTEGRIGELLQGAMMQWPENFSPLDLISEEPLSPGKPALVQASLEPTTSRNQEREQVPCEESLEQGDYELCFAATPWPMTTMPKWLAQWQAEEAVGLVFEQINGIYEELDRNQDQARVAQPLRYVPKRVWLTEIVAQMERSDAPGQGKAVCIDTNDESCQSLPASTGRGSISLLTPAMRAGREGESFRPEARALGELARPDAPGVGPSQEYRRLPERPPPVGKV